MQYQGNCHPADCALSIWFYSKRLMQSLLLANLMHQTDTRTAIFKGATVLQTWCYVCDLRACSGAMLPVFTFGVHDAGQLVRCGNNSLIYLR
jgi:hypothetical protein